ncbi:MULTISPECIES: CesT family type III secretion system chaperone [Pseudomonas syringae group]|uniref:ShcF n=3 Tax=Pseudomonas syringae group genomosp. 3 TaxID=251701 RepID=Q88A89_PSESM|nr:MULTISPECIES: CesT family type III secretion system chaperone [Pseudomonas syringae group]AAO54047.1 type III chaperone protein ShcF [Pseudomonas syringae pv. tomato str. DC3000]AAP83639.1 ShcF [Pseudomonas syringae pv. tomato str. DC3000]KKI24177.1 type III chaperone protein ShcF [Pseudomonas syringae pv. persicae]KPB93116.1 ShcF [Pseudomonas syringae pv. maculicola]KPX67770.1 ShcF [Pseudomonas syringae pv. maculicola]
MKNAFDLLVEGLAKDYNMPPLPDKKHIDEVYCFEFQSGMNVKVYQDEFRWVYFTADVGTFQDSSIDTLNYALQLNNFSLRKPFLTFGMTKEKNGVLHTRTPLIEVDNVQMRRIFEELIGVAGEIRKTLKLK